MCKVTGDICVYVCKVTGDMCVIGDMCVRLLVMLLVICV